MAQSEMNANDKKPKPTKRQSAAVTPNQAGGPAPQTTARLATLDGLIAHVLPAWLDPVPPTPTLREWLDRAGVPRYKTNPLAKRGGGQVYYSVPAVEKLLRRITPPRGGA